MRAVLCEQHGPPEALAVRDVPVPEPRPGEVLIRARAAAVNFPDCLIIQGKYQFQPPLPFVPGAEVAGEIAALGEGVEGLRVGMRVIGLAGHGCFAERVALPASAIVPIGEAMDHEEAAAFLLTYGTSHHALRQRARLQEGETLLVLGASGGVGLAAVELGKAMGAKVIAAASSDERLALCRDRGADEAVNYAQADLKQAIRELTGGRGADVIYDPVGDRFAEPAFRSIAWNGRYLVVGFAGGEIPRLPLNLPLLKGAAVIGVFWGAFTVREPETHRANIEELMRWHRDGRIRPHISRRFPLAEAGAAIRWVMDRRAQGKIVLTIG